ncbi:hypothetical protein DCS32_09395 [Dokdonia sp. Dokd-P16]|uniref:hypothetical protein n=1 Tax=Dokdonia sp. Dokd-P16 TaxID=2173169 RepID=UPI000D5472DA|nr:hypothetical protein [Dokdonia sp. Dokd-P16]AWH74364.1 hypothetical protein DCS32_09395 [Dokdonia sp. Dokd-P16]
MRLFFALMFVCSTVLNGQESREITGRLLNVNDDVAQVTVVNLTRKKGTITSVNGTFKIKVREGDILMIKALQFKTEQLTVTNKIYDSGFIEVFMTPDVSELETVQLSNNGLSGNIKKDAKEVKLVVRPKALGAKREPIAVEYRRLHTATSRPPDQVGRQNLRLDVSLDGILNKISGKTKRLKKAVEIMEYQKKVDQLRSYYADAVFTSSLRIPEEYIDDFTFWVLKDEEQLRDVDLKNKLSTLEYLLSMQKEYKSLLLTQDAQLKGN